MDGLVAVVAGGVAVDTWVQLPLFKVVVVAVGRLEWILSRVML